MEVIVRQETGHELALYGLSLSYKDRATPYKEWWTPERYDKIKKTAKALAFKGKGHNKFLESIQVWVDIEAPRYFWSEFDTYRVGTTKQSESTMHTIRKRDLTLDDFEETGPFFSTLEDFNIIRPAATVQELKALLPESYLQRRLVSTNYKVLQNILAQRWDHKLPEWQVFCERIRESVKYPDYLPARCV